MFELSRQVGAAGKPYRDTFADTLIDLMREDERVVMFEADLGGASLSTKIREAHPERYVQVGIAEANMMGMAAGLSSEGLVPFVHSFGPFATRRAFDQIFMAGGYAHNTIHIWGSDPGFTAGANGGTHTTYEDVALMRTIPGAVVADAADAVQMAWTLKAFAARGGINYLRTGRKESFQLYAEGSTFELGRGNVVRPGEDVLVVSAGQLLKDALAAADALDDAGVSCEVIDMFCIKPLDVDLLVAEAAGKRAVVTFENHGVIGGLGEAVASALLEAGVTPPFRRHGVVERFGSVGTPGYLQEEYGLTAADLVGTVRALLG
ncbi:transketolase family protein [Olsenella sp. HMSC062G07]|uniref:transketolase family protein n=1 Tax=Olsenella sp. HMSC062G07 TaxID=1739330 RepID=UPI0008A22238|nr:transketolase C-terminal domain-containing protein [Olsenella sp. HMSC062G07]OFK22193.1 transketolase [Olsenella sp. HMSC062G07]